MNKPDSPLLMIFSVIMGTVLSLCALLLAKTQTLSSSISGKSVPAFQLPMLDGNLISNTDFIGKNYLIFWGDPGCQPCESAYPILRETSQSLNIIMISEGGREMIKKIKSEFGFTFPIALDSLHLSKDKFGIDAYPAMMIVDKQGYVSKFVTGDTKWSVNLVR